MQRHDILMQERQNGITRVEIEVPSFGIDIVCRAWLKAVLPFDFVNTSDQKLRAHFTHPY